MKLLMPLALLLPSLAFADCPTNYANSGPYDYQNSSPVWFQGIVCGGVGVNLPAGIVGLSGGGGSAHNSCGVSLSVSDIYQIVGPASATPFAFTLRVHLSGNMDASPQFDPLLGNTCYTCTVTSDLNSGGVTDHFQDSSDYFGCISKTIASDRVLALEKFPGEPFTIRFSESVSGPGRGDIHQTFTFEGLPDGYSITSCQGYGNNPTPASNRSWGSIKASYR